MKHTIKIEFTVNCTTEEAGFIRDSVEESAWNKAKMYRAPCSTHSTITSELGRTPSLEEALEEPGEYEIKFGPLGWTLSFVGEEIAICLTNEQAINFVNAAKAKTNE